MSQETTPPAGVPAHDQSRNPEPGPDGRHLHGHHDHDHDHHHTHHDHDGPHGHDHDHEHHHGRPRPRRDGILLAAFGAALPEARAGYELFSAEVRERFPDHALRLAFTAHKA